MTPTSDSTARQFGIGSLLVMTAVCGAVLALARATRAPLLFQTVIAVYLGTLAAYAVLRLPSVYRALTRQTPGWRRLKQHRQQLEAEIADAPRQHPRQAPSPRRSRSP